MLNEIDKEELEKIVETYGIDDVLAALGEIAKVLYIQRIEELEAEVASRAEA